ncbi:MAG: carboxypeptidase-like regulatory domain-containing protein [Bacteroidales bacterium]|nr:carboxypeptidase-like regulatory domain-containing protein [Bacteroidales bacterium]
MKTKLFYALLACFMLLIVTTSCNKKKSESSYLCAITGTVYDFDTGDPIQSATVTLSPSGKSTFTGSDGFFEFLDLDNNQYTVGAQKSGYGYNNKTVNTIAGETVRIIIDLKKNQ